MRPIKFRGICKEEFHTHHEQTEIGEWVYGYLVNPSHIRIPMSEEHGGLGSGIVHVDVEVGPETVGQFTGLIDKNGVEIYEGDIIRHKFKMYADPIEGTKELEGIEGEDVGQMIFKKGCFWFVSVDEQTEICGMIEPDEEDMLGLEVFEFEVIGNVHENPELLEAVQ